MLFCKLLCHGTGSMQYHAVLLGVERQGFLLLSPLPVSPWSDSQMKPVYARCPVWTEKSYFGKLTCLISLHSLPHHSLSVFLFSSGEKNSLIVPASVSVLYLGLSRLD